MQNNSIDVDIAELEKQRTELDVKIRAYYKEQLEKKIDTNRSYIGLTFKRDNEDGSCSYYKILCPNTNNEYRFHTFTFTLPMRFAAEYMWFPEDYFTLVDDMGWLCRRKVNGEDKREIDLYTEITEAEFGLKLKEWFGQIEDMLPERNV